MDGLSVAASGSQACTAAPGTEHELYTTTAPGLWMAQLDLTALASGDTLVARVYARAASGGSLLQVAVWTWSGAQDGSTSALSPLKDLDARPLGGPFGWRVTIRQTAGSTGRTVPWAVTQVSP